MAKRKITPVGAPIGRTRSGQMLQMDAAKADALVAVGRARYWVEPKPQPPAPRVPVRGIRPKPSPDRLVRAMSRAMVAAVEEGVPPAPETEPAAAAPAPQEENQQPEEDDEVRISPRTGKPVRRYRRRDMTAEE